MINKYKNKTYVEALTTHYSFMVNTIKNITKNILIKNDVDGPRPIKNTSKEDCYKALYEIQELLRRSEQRHGGFTHD